MSPWLTEWGRAYRGRRWHLLNGNRLPCCVADYAIEEVNRGLPPVGGVVCQRCVERVQETRRAVEAALAQESFVTGQPAAPNEYTTEAGANP